MREKIGIVIADDHPISRDGLKFYLSFEEQLEIIGEAENGAELVELVDKVQPELAIIDVDMPVMGGIEAAQIIRERHPHIKLVLLTMLKDRNVYMRMQEIGIEGYILKDNASKEIVLGIKEIIADGTYLSAEVKAMVEAAPADAVPFDHPLRNLTSSEIRILQKTGEFLTSTQIADELYVSKKTVSNHRNNICKKLNLSGQHSLMKYAAEHLHIIKILSDS